MGRGQHATVIGKIENVAVIVGVVHASATAYNVATGQSTGRIQPPGQVAYVEFHGVHDAVDRAGGIGFGTARGVGHVVVAHFAFARVIEVDGPPAIGSRDVSRIHSHVGAQLLKDQNRVGVE